jgi:glutamate-ammonia-ligase adenylyltransferase
MIASYEDLSPEALAPLGFDSPVQACRLLQEMAGHDIPDSLFAAVLQALIPALADCADPDRAVANLVRWGEAVGSRATAYQFLAASPPAGRILVTVLAASQFFADLLIRDPEYLEALTNPTLRKKARSADAIWADLSRRVGIAKTPNSRRDALRRAKGPEVLRIGVRDLLGDAEMPVIAREISDFADGCVRMALQICVEERDDAKTPAFAVIAMGKLGGMELNYSSDIDLIFVHGDDEDAAVCIRLAEAVRDTLAKVTPSGYLFRVDLRLRPEGRFGPVSRSLSSCRAYYESWAEPWERQALLKARAVAGDADLGAVFIEMTQAFAYQTRTEETVVESIRQNKRRLEEKIARAGETDVNVKEGLGGIRDIEFPVQLMLLLAGGINPSLRTGNTLEALDRLTSLGLLTDAECVILSESYIFLRTVEHRLQLLDDRAVRCLPRESGALRKFGRVLGYADGENFLADYRQRTQRVHRLFEQLFYREPGDAETVEDVGTVRRWALAPDDPEAQEGLRTALATRGFRDIEAAVTHLRLLAAGSAYGDVTPEARAGFAALADALLDAAAQTIRPDDALRGLVSLAQAAPSPAVLYQSLRENPRLLPRFCSLAGEAPALWQILLSHLEFWDLLSDEEAMDRALTTQMSTGRITPEALARSALRSRLHTGARDVWQIIDVAEAISETTTTARALLDSGLALARIETGLDVPLAIIGLGKFGGGELGYGSDWDVLYVGDPSTLADTTRLVERLQHLLREDLRPFGVRFEIDARLRPEGRKGALVLDIATYRDYYEHRAATWERQTLLKARAVAGDVRLGGEFAALAQAVVFAHPATPAEEEEIRAMKHRLETERSKGPQDLKLGPGGLSDVEWTAQLLQLRHGVRRKALRVPNTLSALRGLRDEALITQADWETLDNAYRLLTHLRNHQFLQTGVGSDVAASPTETLQATMRETRDVCRRLFYGT